MTGLLIENTLLRQTEVSVEKTVPAYDRDNYLKIVVAGMKYAMFKGSDSVIASLRNSKDPLSDSVKGAIAIVGALRQGAKGTMPIKPMVAAALTLMLHALDFAEKMKLLTITPDELDRATQLFMDTILPYLKVPKETLDASLEQVHTLLRDPDKMTQYEGYKNGASKLG